MRDNNSRVEIHRNVEVNYKLLIEKNFEEAKKGIDGLNTIKSILDYLTKNSYKDLEKIYGDQLYDKEFLNGLYYGIQKYRHIIRTYDDFYQSIQKFENELEEAEYLLDSAILVADKDLVNRLKEKFVDFDISIHIPLINKMDKEEIKILYSIILYNFNIFLIKLGEVDPEDLLIYTDLNKDVIVRANEFIRNNPINPYTDTLNKSELIRANEFIKNNPINSIKIHGIEFK